VKEALFSPSIEKYVRENYLKLGTFEKVKNSVNEKFNKNFNYNQIKIWCNWRRLYLGKKGKKNGKLGKPIGSERKGNGNGIIMIKTEEGWKQKNIYIWEKENGKIPIDHCLIFLDGDKNNCTLENLLLIEKKTLSYLNKYKLLRFNDPELTRVAVNIAIQKRLINKKLKAIHGKNFLNYIRSKEYKQILKGEK